MLVYVADDSATWRVFLRGLVEPVAAVREFRTGLELVRALGQVVPDAVISDLYMPDQDGLGVLMETRRRGIPTAIVTAGSRRGLDQTSLDAARKLGAMVLRKDATGLEAELLAFLERARG